MPNVTPEEMRKLALDLRMRASVHQFSTDAKTLAALDAGADALDSAARQLAPRTGTPERDGEYLVAIQWSREHVIHETFVWRDGRWRDREDDAVDDDVIAWWPLPPAADVAQEANPCL